MPDMLQVNLPVAQKDYALTPRPVDQQQQFNIYQTDKITAPTERFEQNSGDNAMFDENALNRLTSELAGNPSNAASTLKSLLSSKMFGMLAKSGNEALLSKVTEFASEIMLSSDNIAADMLSQQSEQSKFSGEFFDTLRSILNSAQSEGDIKNAVSNLLKAIVNASSRQDILNSLAGNMQYLAENISTSAALTEQLNNLAKALSSPNATQNFAQLKSEVMNVLRTLNSSLLLTDKTRSLMNLMNYSLSRYNANPDILKDALSQLTGKLSDSALIDKLTAQFNQMVENSPFPSDVKFATLINYQNTLEEASSENPVFENLTSEASMSAISKYLSELADSTMSKVSADELKLALLNVNSLSGTPVDALKHMLTLITGVNGSKSVELLMNEFTASGDLNALIDRLGVIINNIGNTDAKLAVAQSFNELLTSIANQQGISYHPPTSMDNFISFLAKNINDNALGQLNPLTKEDILGSMLTSPGVYTPLQHFLLPLRDGNTKAFGELWVDPVPDEENGNHLFLCFDVSDAGYFELEIYNKKEELTVNLFTPPEHDKAFSSMKTFIPKIAASKGYYIRSANVSPLTKKRALDDVFPKLKEKRSGLNEKI